MEQERMLFADEGLRVTVPEFVKEIVAEITSLARRSPDINQRSGVSVRASIADYESLLANAQRRAISV
jgi:magnesium chelatase subunit I